MPIVELRVGLSRHDQERYAAVVRHAGVRESCKGAELLRPEIGTAETGKESSRPTPRLTVGHRVARILESCVSGATEGDSHPIPGELHLGRSAAPQAAPSSAWVPFG